MDTAKTGAYLASLRKAAGMTQQDAADRLGVSNKTVSKWESGGGFPDITVLPALAELYGVTADDILAGEPVEACRCLGYRARRGELRWRIGFSAAALFLLAAIVFQGYVWSWLLAAGGAAAIWIGWGRCGGEEIRRRLVLLLPWAVGLVWYVLCYFQWALRLATALTEDYANGYSVIYYLAYMLRWDMLLVLLAAVYGLLRAAAVRWSGQGCLLNRPYLQVTGILWLISLAVEIVRWIVTLPPMQAFAATTLSSGTRTYQALWDKFAATLPFLYVPRITAAVVLTVLAVTALAVRRKNGAGAAQSKDEAA